MTINEYIERYNINESITELYCSGSDITSLEGTTVINPPPRNR